MLPCYANVQISTVYGFIVLGVCAAGLGRALFASPTACLFILIRAFRLFSHKCWSHLRYSRISRVSHHSYMVHQPVIRRGIALVYLHGSSPVNQQQISQHSVLVSTCHWSRLILRIYRRKKAADPNNHIELLHQLVHLESFDTIMRHKLRLSGHIDGSSCHCTDDARE